MDRLKGSSSQLSISQYEEEIPAKGGLRTRVLRIMGELKKWAKEKLLLFRGWWLSIDTLIRTFYGSIEKAFDFG